MAKSKIEIPNAPEEVKEDAPLKVFNYCGILFIGRLMEMTETTVYLSDCLQVHTVFTPQGPSMALLPISFPLNGGLAKIKFLKGLIFAEHDALGLQDAYLNAVHDMTSNIRVAH